MNLGLLQIADSALPISGYTHSWGLEAAVSSGSVHDPATLENWVRHWLRSVLGPFEGVLVAQASSASDRGDARTLGLLNELAEVSLLPATIRRASREMGEQLVALGATWQWCAARLQELLGPDSAGEAWHHPVAFGMLGSLAGAPTRDVLTAYLHQAAMGIVAAGVRSIPVGHTHGQQLIAYLHDDIRDLVEILPQRELESAGSGCPSYEILCDEQTRLYARMFRS